MSIWAIIWIGLITLSLGVSLAEHGEPKRGYHNVGVTLISVGIQWFILYMGGFFS